MALNGRPFHGCLLCLVFAVVGCSGGVDGAARKPGRGYYDAEGRLRASFALPLRECSALCGCNRNCANRVVQKGIQQPGLQIHWMGKKGWGITCSQPLAAGTFIAECELLSRVPEQTCGCFRLLC